MKLDAKKLTCLIAAAVLVVVGVVAASRIGKPKQALYETMKVEALHEGEHGIKADTSFSVTLDRSINEEALRALLRLEPELEYTLSGSGRKWVLTPVQPLSRNAVYTIRAINGEGGVMRSFAFQTDSGLLVNTVYPRAGSNYVDPQTGIEITFNTVGVDAASYFEILPETKGAFRTTGNTTVFVPAEPLEMDNVYRVTVKKGLMAPNGMVLEEDYTFAFETALERKGETGIRLTGLYSETFLPVDPVVVELTSFQPENEAMEVTVHRFASTEAYADALTERSGFYNTRVGPKRDYLLNTAALELVLREERVLEQVPNSWSGQRRVTLAEGLPEGCYAITITPQGEQTVPVQKLVQVCKVAVYTQSVSGETLVWLNDVGGGTPMVGARVQLQEQDSAEQRAGVTNAEGVLTLQTGEMQSSAWLSVTQGGRLAYFGEAMLNAVDEVALSESYYSALYTDRALYQPSDTIRLWGVLYPRGGAALPSTADAVLSGTDEICRTTVDIKADGTFTAELPFYGIEQSRYSVALIEPKSERAYRSTHVKIEKFAKPGLTITATHDRKWYYANEAIDFLLAATYYDGTPAAGLQLRLRGNDLTGKPEGTVRSGENAEVGRVMWQDTLTEAEKNSLQSGTLVTLDEYGRAMATSGVTQDHYSRGWLPTSVYYTVDPASSENTYAGTEGSVLMLPSRYAVETERTENDSIIVRTAHFNTAAVDKTERDYTKTTFEQYAGAPAELAITVEIIETLRHETVVETYYDEVEKKMMPRYSYEYEDVVITTQQLTTTGGSVEWQLNGAWPQEENRQIYAQVIFPSGMGYDIAEGVYRRSPSMEFERGRYVLRPEGEGDTPRFAVDEKISLQLFYGAQPTQNKGRLLYSLAQSKVLSTTITGDDAVSLPFTEEYIPGVTVYGAYFDGRHIYLLEEVSLRYNYGERTLAVEVAAEHEAYAPGEEAAVTITLRNAAGKPTAGSACIGVVDESIFQLAPQTVDLVGQLYNVWLSAPAARSVTFVAYNSANPNTEGGMGGGGGSGAAVRADFADTALFQTVQVDASGTATVQLKMPDNITEWRLTAVAATADGAGGDTTGSTVTTLPFYVRTVVTDTYLEGDDITAAVMGVGKELTLGEPVQYTARVLDAKGVTIAEQSISEVAGKQAYFNFGKCAQKGSYKLQVKASSARDSDETELPFTVVPSGTALRVTERMALADIVSIEPMRWPVTVSVFDEELETYMNGLAVLSGRSGARTEVLAAAYRARVMQNELLPEEQRGEVTREGLTAIQDYESGVKPLPDAEPDAALTAKLLLTAPQVLNKEFAQVYLYHVIKNPSATDDSRVMAYVGLAALREPVLLDVRAMAKMQALTNAQRLYLGAALAALGDFEGANAIYTELAQSKKTTEDGAAYLTGNNKNEELANTGAALTLCSISGHADAEALMKYLSAHAKQPRSKEETTLVELDMLAYLHYYRFSDDARGSFRYHKNGEQHTVELDARGATAITLTAENFADANITAVKGKLAANVTYQKQAQLSNPAPYLTVQKEYTTVASDMPVATQLTRVDIRVTFTKDAPEGMYMVYDTIRSGMRYYDVGTGELTGRSGAYPWWQRVENEGQQVQSSIWLRHGDGPVPLTVDENALPNGAVATESPVAGGAVANPTVEANTEMPQTATTTDVIEGDEEQGVYTVSYYVINSLPGAYKNVAAYVVDRNGIPVATSQE